MSKTPDTQTREGDGSRAALEEFTTPAVREPLDLELRSISKEFDRIRALANVTLSIKGGEILGLCGHNGAGKSTLMKILMGLEEPTSGDIVLDGEPIRLRNAEAAHRLGISIVDQELGLVPALTVEENLFLGNLGESFLIHRRARRAKAKALLQAVGLGDLDLARSLASLLPGERKLVECAHVLGHRPRLMILDEPTASLSYGEAKRIFEAARGAASRGAAVVFVSHRLDEVFELCDRIAVLRDGALVGTAEAESLGRGSLVEMMIGDVTESPGRPPTSRTSLSVSIRGLSVPPRVDAVDLDMPPGAIVGLAGQVGSGASDILRGLGGLEEVGGGILTIGERAVPLRGEPSRMGRLGVHYVTNDRKQEGLFLDHGIDKNLTALELKSLAGFGFSLTPRTQQKAARALADSIELRYGRIGQKVGELSGGNQQKVLIGRCLAGAARSLLLLDDPTRGVDVGGRSEIHDLVRQAADRGTAVLFVSTELDELLDLADVIVTIYRGAIVSTAARADVSRHQILAEMTNAAAAVG